MYLRTSKVSKREEKGEMKWPCEYFESFERPDFNEVLESPSRKRRDQGGFPMI